MYLAVHYSFIGPVESLGFLLDKLLLWKQNKKKQQTENNNNNNKFTVLLNPNDLVK